MTLLRTAYSIFVLIAVTVFWTPFVALTRVVTGSQRRAYSFVRLWGQTLVAIFGVRIRSVYNTRPDFSRPAVYLSNHLSQADIPILMSAIPAGLAFVAKQSLANIPFLSWSMRLVGMVFISRTNTERAIESMNRAASSMSLEMNALVFPEGTRSPTGGRILHSLKKGGFHFAIASGRPIQPVAVVDSEHVLARNGLAIYPGAVEVRFGRLIEVHPTSTVEDLMRQYRDEMERILADEPKAANIAA
jgi:1-acyl-sn-glycerol-3-phosphate acyltransferase